MKGYFGKFLKIDLTGGNTEEIIISDADQKNYIGGSTLAAKLIYDYVKPDMDPLSPDNPIVFATGPFTGSNVPHGQPGRHMRYLPGNRLMGRGYHRRKIPHTPERNRI